MTTKMVTRVCRYCGKEFQFAEYRIAYGMGKYCSHKCADTANKGIRAERIKRICKGCGKEFQIRKQELINGSHKGEFCSKKCRTIERIVKKCLNCSAEFEVKITDDKIYCSKKCADKSSIRNEKIGGKQKALHHNKDFRDRFLNWIKERSASEKWKNSPHFQKGEKHPAYKGNKSKRQEERARYQYKQWRKDVFSRDDYTCQKCGARGVYIHAHHIKEWAKYPELRYELSNGLTVCVPCHKEIHKKR